jgi:hypothetical protein
MTSLLEFHKNLSIGSKDIGGRRDTDKQRQTEENSKALFFKECKQ